MKSTKLTGDQINQALSTIVGWRFCEGKLHREFRFQNFNEAWGFMSRAALVAEAMNHHPEWFNVWSTVRVDLCTHDAGGVTEKDVELATAMNRFAPSA